MRMPLVARRTYSHASEKELDVNIDEEHLVFVVWCRELQQVW